MLREVLEFRTTVENLCDVSGHDSLHIVEVILEPLQVLLRSCVDIQLLGLFYKFICGQQEAGGESLLPYSKQVFQAFSFLTKMIHRADKLVRS